MQGIHQLKTQENTLAYLSWKHAYLLCYKTYNLIMQENTLAYYAGERTHLFSLIVQDNTLAYCVGKHASLLYEKTH